MAPFEVQHFGWKLKGHHEAVTGKLCMRLLWSLKSMNSLLIHNRASIILSTCRSECISSSCVNAEHVNSNLRIRNDRCSSQTHTYTHARIHQACKGLLCVRLVALCFLENTLKYLTEAVLDHL